MAFGVFIHRSDSQYDDVPSSKYQFPPQYLSRAKNCEGDWILYYEPIKAPESKGYYAVAKVQEIIPDPAGKGMFLAIIEKGTYLDFGDPVPFKDDSGVIEKGLLNDLGKISGRAQSAIRTISNSDFWRIVEKGIEGEEKILPRANEGVGHSGFGEPQISFEGPFARQRIEVLASRNIRDKNFRKTVLRAYRERCAITGLRLINGGGRAEVEAAHIMSVEKGGPDILTNGIALSGTAHWMFDRGLIGLDDDLTILVSRQTNDLNAVKSLINETGRLIAPVRQADRPHKEFLYWHRTNQFKN